MSLPRQYFIACFTLLLLIACSGDSDNSAENQARVAAYLDEFIAILQQNALTRHDVNWAQLDSDVKALAANAETIPAAFPAIRRALEIINTNHSFYRPANGSATIYPSNLVCAENVLSDIPEHEDIGYIRVDSFSGSTTEASALAASLQQQIRQQDHAGIRGWVVDLRHNRGGNMWPMIAGLGPLLGDGIAGYFIDPDEQQISWGYQQGASFITSPLVTVEDYYELLVPEPRIAVLSSAQVASSGEATLIALKGLDNSRVFGSDSCGLSTSNSSFSLSDGAQLFLTTSIMADRHLNRFGARVPADEHVSQQYVLNRAVAWILAP